MGLWRLDLVPLLAGPEPELSPVDLFPLSQPVPPSPSGTPPRPGTSHGPTCGIWGTLLTAKKRGG